MTEKSATTQRRSRLVVIVIGLLVVAIAVGAVIAWSSDSAAPGGAVPAPDRGALFGISRYPGSYGLPVRVQDRQSVIEQAEQRVGRRFDIDHQFFRFGDMIPNPYLRWTAEQGRIPYASLNAVRRDGTHARWADIATGRYDRYLRRLATSIRRFDVPMLFTFHHEPESELCRPQSECDGPETYGTAQDYVAAWRHVVEVFRAEKVAKVSYVWVTTGYRFDDPNDYRYGPRLYPGDDVIDWIGIDPFNFVTRGRPDFTQWYSMRDLIRHWYDWAESRGRPLMLAEFGCLEDPDDPNRRARWFDDARESLEREFPKIKALNYYDAYREDEPGYDWRLFAREHDDGLVAFTRWVTTPYFNTRS